jgi:hypothetical protein
MSRKLKVKLPRLDEAGLTRVAESVPLPGASLKVKIQIRGRQFWRREMSPTQGKPDDANAVTAAQLATRPRVIVAADANDVMREQLDFLIEHAQDGNCGCAQCQRYLRARALLMEAFADSPRAALMKKASSPSRN